MSSGPSRIAETIVTVLVPPACREEVVGDLHERFTSRWQYAAEALAAVPLVILSRMRRTADPQILLIQAFALYISFLSAAWLRDQALLREQWGLVRLALPAAIAMLGLVLDDTYARPGPRSSLKLARGPLLGISVALISQGLLWTTNSERALPRWIALYGCAMSLLLSSAIRMLFPPASGQSFSMNAPALWLKYAGESRGGLRGTIAVLKGILVVVILAAMSTWIAKRSVPPKAGFAMLVVVLAVAYQIVKRG